MTFEEDDLSSDVYSMGCIFWKFYNVTFEITNQKSTFGFFCFYVGNVFDKSSIMKHPFQKDYEPISGVTREKMYERLLDESRISKKIPVDGNIHFPVGIFINLVIGYDF